MHTRTQFFPCVTPHSPSMARTSFGRYGYELSLSLSHTHILPMCHTPILPTRHALVHRFQGTSALRVTADRAHFKPPESLEHPEWSDTQKSRSGALHWDVHTSEAEWPVPFAIQGLVYLEACAHDQGALRVVPRFHHRLEGWSRALPSDRDGMRPSPESLPLSEAVPLAGGVGALVVWCSALPHGPTRNLSTRPRVSAYLSMLPVDAAPFLGARGRDGSEPLNLADAGTCRYEQLEADERRMLRRLVGTAFDPLTLNPIRAHMCHTPQLVS